MAKTSPWLFRSEIAAYHQVRVYCSLCGSLIEPEIKRCIFNELSNEIQHPETALHCDVSVLENRHFDAEKNFGWVSLYRLSAWRRDNSL